MAKSKEELDAEQRQREHERDLAAKKRFTEGRFARVLANPTQYNRWEAKAAQEWQAQQDAEARESALRKHEVDMVEKKGAIEKDVAGIKAGADVEIGKMRFGFTDYKGVHHDGSETLTERERQMGAERLGKLQFGSYDEKGNYKPGSSVLTEREKGIAAKTLTEQQSKDALALEQQRGKTAKEVAEISGNAQVDAAEATATAKEQARQERYAAREQREFEKWQRSKNKGLTPAEEAAYNKMSPDDQKEYWKKKTSRKKEVKRERNSRTGEVRITYDDGSTEIVKG